MNIKKLWHTFRCTHIVKFDNGKYGIKSGWIFKKYLNMYWSFVTWDALNQSCRNEVQKDNLQDVASRYDLLIGADEGKPVLIERYVDDSEENTEESKPLERSETLGQLVGRIGRL